jgi:uncharacterized membrane protein
MSKLDRHIHQKLGEWAAAGLITSEQAAAIRSHEPQEKPGLPWGVVIFAGFGAVVLGLGVILLFAYNWDQMHKFAKLAVVFAALALAHGTALGLRRRESWGGFAESVQLLGTMLFGAGIWLVAQIYHISAHYPNAFIVWALGALLLAWLIPSVSQGLLASVLLVIWAGAEAGSFGNHLAVAPPLVLFGSGWLAWRLRSSVLLAVTAGSFAVSAATGFFYNSESVFLILSSVAVLYGSLAWLVSGHATFPSAAVILRVSGMVIYFPLLFILTFHDVAEELLGHRGWDSSAFQGADCIPAFLLVIVTLGMTGCAMRRAVGDQSCNTPEFRERLVAPAVILLMVLVFSVLWRLDVHSFKSVAAVVSTVASVIFLYHTVANLWRGCRDTLLSSVVGGSLLIAVWVFARYADLFDSLLARGVMFLFMGAALFAVAILYHRRKNKARAVGEGSASVAVNEISD